jgi:hypothetical protein
MANCQKCGENNSAEARFCSSCGVAIGLTSIPPPPPVSRVVVLPIFYSAHLGGVVRY